MLCTGDRPLSNCRHQQVIEAWPLSAIFWSVKDISHVPRELNKVKNFGDVYMQII